MEIHPPKRSRKMSEPRASRDLNNWVGSNWTALLRCNSLHLDLNRSRFLRMSKSAKFEDILPLLVSTYQQGPELRLLFERQTVRIISVEVSSRLAC
jgi:hypothetical protein